MDSSLSYIELLPKLRRVFWSLLHAYSLSRASQKQLIFPGVKLSWTWPLAMGTSFRDPDCGFSPQVLWVNGLGEWGCGRIFGLSTRIQFLPLALRAKFPSIPVITLSHPHASAEEKPAPNPGGVPVWLLQKRTWDSTKTNFTSGKGYDGISRKGLPCSGKFAEGAIHSASRHCHPWGPNCWEQAQKQINSKWRAVPREAEWSWNPWLYQVWNVCFLWTSRYEKLSSYLI